MEIQHMIIRLSLTIIAKKLIKDADLSSIRGLA